MKSSKSSKSSNKRRPDQYYQPAITGWFSASSGSLTKRSSNAPPPPPPPPITIESTPRLPESTQRSLLQVGMRVRKSLAEGYKSTITGGFNSGDDSYSYAKSGASIREAYYNPIPRAEEPESLPNSQESGVSRKRRVEDSDSEDEESQGVVQIGGIGTNMLDYDGRDGYVGEEQAEWQLPPTTFLPAPSEFVPGRGGRQRISPRPRHGHGRSGSFHMSVPRGISTFGIGEGGGGGGDMAMDVEMSDDFGEASFLRPATEFGR